MKLKFDYITECSPKISNFQADKMKPSYLKVIGLDPTYFVYTGVGKHATVFKRDFDSISPPHNSFIPQNMDVAETMFTGLKKLNL